MLQTVFKSLVSERECSTVFVADDDEAILETLGNLFRSVGLQVLPCNTVFHLMERMKRYSPKEAGCLVLSLQMPEMNGLAVQEQLVASGVRIPIVMMSGEGDIGMVVRAMKLGAVDVLAKPLCAQKMLDAVVSAIEAERSRRNTETAMLNLRTRYQSLTTREHQVMTYVTAGLMNKQIAARIGISEVTVKIHRRGVMTKMKARSLAELVRMDELLSSVFPNKRLMRII
jgi:FixJ family two-component response regulator